METGVCDPAGIEWVFGLAYTAIAVTPRVVLPERLPASRQPRRTSIDSTPAHHTVPPPATRTTVHGPVRRRAQQVLTVSP